MTQAEPGDRGAPSSSRDGAPNIEASIRRIGKLQIFAVALVIAVAILWTLSDVILLLFAATLLACQLIGMARFLVRHLRLPYGLALVVVILAIIAVTGIGFWFRGPVVVAELTAIADQVQTHIVDFWRNLGEVSWLKSLVDRIQVYTHNHRGSFTGVAEGFVTSTIGNAGSFLLIVVAAVYLAASPKLYVDGFIMLLPHPWRRRANEVAEEEGSTLRWWFIGQLIDMAFIGVLSGAGLFLLGVKLSFTLGLVAALFNFVPYVGALAGSIPAIIVGLGNGPWTALYVAILFLAIQTIEGNVVSPLIQRRTVDLPPVLTLLSQTVLGTLFGPLGLILATPITAALMVFVKMVYVDTILGAHAMHGEDGRSSDISGARE